ncbi:MAG: hypothetical protein KDJ99_27000 [Candidatus Competibacteraceae bacterium]|nr:hypothetical protein [Candidatus Competibacteraceae bacterium]
MVWSDDNGAWYCWDNIQEQFVLMDAELTQRRQVYLSKSPPSAEFLKGPIPLAWLETAASSPGKTLNAALAIWFVYGLTRQQTFVVKRKTWERFNLTRQAFNRALDALESKGLIAVDRQAGCYPKITLKIAI